MSYENWGSYDRLNISKKKKKKRFPWGRSGGKTIFRSPAPLIKAVRAFEIQEIGRFRAYIREKRGCFAAPFFANIWPRFARPSWPRPRGRPRSASKSFIYSSSSRNPYLLARARTSSCPRLLSGLGTTSGQPRKTASGSLNRVKKGDLVKKSGFWSEILDFSVFFVLKWMDIGQIRVYMTSVVIIWPRDDLGGRPQVASDDLKRPQMTSILL